MTSLVDNSVYDARGNLVGKLQELVIDSRTGCVRRAVLAGAASWGSDDGDSPFRGAH